MQRRSREINIFSLSALDLFCGAMGAFMLLALIALPYYLKRNIPLEQELARLREEVSALTAMNGRLEEELRQSQEAREQAEQERDQAEQERDQAEQQVLECQEKLAKTFLVVIASWETPADIDLHVRTPRNNHYYFKSHNRRSGDSGPRPHFPNEEAELSIDSLRAGVEVWQMLEAKPGEYAISIDKYNAHGDRAATPVKMVVLYRDGTHSLTVPSLTRENEEKRVMTIAVDDGGNVTIR
ncbi:MAG: hypothetical protein LBS31_12775 [Candidatus Adiutrix sp.]|jgi:hypothetical protein|nr:hypothetical protein [Candidatus Adiutrix sp.]